MPLIDAIVGEITPIIQGALRETDLVVSERNERTLLRRLKANYATLNVDALMGIQGSLGHVAGESKPCPVCRVMAREQLKLMED